MDGLGEDASPRACAPRRGNRPGFELDSNWHTGVLLDKLGIGVLMAAFGTRYISLRHTGRGHHALHDGDVGAAVWDQIAVVL